MAFLDNSGDIILDAVLTDTGRLRLAQGDGSFKITKFALGDDEINYGNYDKDHASGSAYYDLEILQTPVLEAFTNNTANLNSKLMSISRTNLLYMPELLINARQPGPNTNYQPLPSRWYYRSDSDGSTDVHTSYLNTRFVVAVDNDTWLTLSNNLNAAGVGQSLRGAIQGYKHDNNNGQPAGSLIRVDQGMNTDQINPLAGMDSDLLETQYIIETDYRLGRLAHQSSFNVADVNFIDDDNVASYYVSSANNYVKNNNNTLTFASASKEGDPQVFKGPRGTSLMFRLHASTELQYSNYLFTQIGKQLTETEAQQQLGISTGVNGNLGAESTGNGTAYVIDTTIRVVGANTGFRIDIPVRYLKIE
tara:strand:+ start:482 stop:1570 length:1089 start_codon:yes stop_codon:yes gene_type:complete